MLIMDGPAGTKDKKFRYAKVRLRKNAKMKTTKIENIDQDLTPPKIKREKKRKKVTHPTVKKGDSELRDKKYTYIIISTGK